METTAVLEKETAPADPYGGGPLPPLPKAPPPVDEPLLRIDLPEWLTWARIRLYVWSTLGPAVALSVVLRLREWAEINGWVFSGKGFTFASRFYETNLLKWSLGALYSPVSAFRMFLIWVLLAVVCLGLRRLFSPQIKKASP